MTDIDEETKKKVLAISLGSQLPTDDMSLERATCIALTMRSEYIAKGTWEPVLEVWLYNPQTQHGTILSCLYSMVPNPADIFQTILHSNPSAQNIALVIHGILSNPMEIDDQFTLLMQIIENEEQKPVIPLALHRCYGTVTVSVSQYHPSYQSSQHISTVYSPGAKPAISVSTLKQQMQKQDPGGFSMVRM